MLKIVFDSKIRENVNDARKIIDTAQKCIREVRINYYTRQEASKFFLGPYPAWGCF